MTDKKSWHSFLVAGLVLGIGFINQQLSFPLQCLLIICFVVKCDVRLLPAIYVLCINKYNFLFFGETSRAAIHFMSGFNLTPVLTFKLTTFFIASYFCLRTYLKKDAICTIIWLMMLIPCAVIAYMARLDNVSFWPMTVDVFLCYSLYVWGLELGKSWFAGRDVFVKQMLLVLFVQTALEARGAFYVFTFSEWPMAVCFAICAFKRQFSLFWKIIGLFSVLFSFYGVFLANYIQDLSQMGIGDSAKIGSTFTRVFCFVVAFCFSCVLWKKRGAMRFLRVVPIVTIIASTLLVMFAVGKATSTKASDVVSNKYEGNLLARFEYKLIGDRGAVWAEGIREMFNDSPYVFKKLDHFVEVQAVIDAAGHIKGHINGIKVAPHNQVITLIARFGWWLGLSMVILLGVIYFRTFRVSVFFDSATLIALLAPHFAVFWGVGTTGQTVADGSILSNGLTTLISPGILYGCYLWKSRLYLSENDSTKGIQYENTLGMRWSHARGR